MKRELQIIARWWLPVAVLAVWMSALVGCGPGPMLEESDVKASPPMETVIASLGGRGISSIHASIQPEVYLRVGHKCAGEDFNAGILNPEGQCTDGYSFGRTIVLTRWEKWSESALCHEVLHFLGWDHDGADFVVGSEGHKREEHCRGALAALPAEFMR